MKFFSSIIYWITRGLTKIITKTIYPVKVHGKANALLDEPYILCSNHISILDPIMLVGAVLHKKVYFMGKAELYKGKIGNWLFRSLLSFPVNRGTADMSAIRTSIKLLNDGKSLIIFPEGTRNSQKDGSLQELYNGVGIIALNAKCKIIPCFIDAKGGYLFFNKFNINVGEPIDIDKYLENGVKKENLSEVMALLREKIEFLM